MSLFPLNSTFTPAEYKDASSGVPVRTPEDIQEDAQQRFAKRAVLVDLADLDEVLSYLDYLDFRTSSSSSVVLNFDELRRIRDLVSAYLPG